LSRLLALKLKCETWRHTAVSGSLKEQVSSIAEREQLEAALNTLREGDKLVCTRLDRLARSV